MAGLRDWLAQIFGHGDTPAESTAIIADDAPPLPPAEWDDSLSLTLSQIATDTTTKASGRVQVITLAHLRHALGDQWEKHRLRVGLVAETTIGRMIGKGNTYLPQDEDSWMLLMPAFSEQDAEEKADAIARAIGEKLIGERFSEREPPMPQAAKVDLDKVMRADGSFDLDAAKLAVRRARLALAARDAKRPADILRRAQESSPTSVASRFVDVTMVYRPSWSADTQSLDTFSLRGLDQRGEIVFGRADTDPGGRLDDTTVADVIKAGLGAFTSMVGSNLRARFALPVPYAVMRRRIGPALFRAVSALPQRDRLMHLRIEVCGVPADAAVDELLDIREFFRGRVRDIVFVMALDHISDKVMALDHIGVGAECPAGALEDDIKRQFLAFRRMAGSKRACALGLRTPELVADMVKAGFDEVSGNGLCDDLRQLPSQIRIIHRDELVRGLASGHAGSPDAGSDNFGSPNAG